MRRIVLLLLILCWSACYTKSQWPNMRLYQTVKADVRLVPFMFDQTSLRLKVRLWEFSCVVTMAFLAERVVASLTVRVLDMELWCKLHAITMPAQPDSTSFSGFLLLSGDPVCMVPCTEDLFGFCLAPLGISNGLARL